MVPNSLPLPLQGPLVRTQAPPLSQRFPASAGDRREGPANPQPEQASESPPAGPHHGTEEEPTQGSSGPNVSSRARGHEPRPVHLQTQCHWSPSVTHGASGHLGLGTVPLAPTRGPRLTAHLGPHLLDPSSPRAQPPGTTFPRPRTAAPARPPVLGRQGRAWTQTSFPRQHGRLRPATGDPEF